MRRSGLRRIWNACGTRVLGLIEVGVGVRVRNGDGRS